VRKIWLTAPCKNTEVKNCIAVVDIDPATIENIGHENIISQIGTQRALQNGTTVPPFTEWFFNLYVFEGMKHREIAAHLKIF